MNLSWLLPEIKGIPVLMYHKVLSNLNDNLTITPEKLRQQWDFLKQEGYSTISLGDFLEFIKNGGYTNQKLVLLTFDDGYLNNYEYVYPMLQEMAWNATFFIIADTLGDNLQQLYDKDNPKMSLNELKQLDSSVIQLGMHGYHHENFNKISFDEIKYVLQKSIDKFDSSGLGYYKVLAYPYGARPRDKQILTAMKTWMADNGIVAGFRIGNQVCRIPAPDIFEIKRIDIKGTDTLDEFKIKLKKGKLKPF